MPNTTTLNETTLSPLTGTEFVRLATPGANWKTQLTNIAPTFATGNMSFFVSTTGSDSNNGTSAATPWATLKHAINVINGIDWGQGFNVHNSLPQAVGFVPTINFAAGTYNATNQGFSAAAFSYGTLPIPALRGNPGEPIFIVGDNVTPANVVWDMTTSTWQIAMLQNSCINPTGIHFKCDNLIFATQEANALLFCIGRNSGNQNFIEIETVSGSSGFVPVFFGTIRPGGSLLALAAAGATWTASFFNITMSGSSNVADFTGLTQTIGGGSVTDPGLTGITLTTDFQATQGFFFLEEYSFCNYVTAFMTGGNHIIGSGAYLDGSSEIQTDVGPLSFPGSIAPFVDRFSAWRAGNSGSFPYSQILYPTLVAGGPPTTSDLFDHAWGVFDGGAGGIWLAANKGGTIFKVQLV